MIQGTWNGALLGAWNPSAGAVAAETISGQLFAQALQWSCQSVVNGTSLPVIAGTQINLTAWLNAADLAGHPTDSLPWTVGVGVMFTTAAGAVSYQTIATIASGAGWTAVSGQITVPPLAVKMSPWLQLNATPSLIGSYYAQAAAIAFTTSFNGWSILDMPGSPAPRQIDFSMIDSIGDATSPFTQQSQLQQWPGADWWELNVSMPPMGRNPQALDAWIAWLAGLQGKLQVFQVGNPLKARPRGAPVGSPVVNGASAGYNLATSSTLYIRGCAPNRMGFLLPGDHLQVGYRLHVVMGIAPVNTDSAGNAAIPVWPSLREAPVDGQPIYLNNAKGLFRLASNARKFTESYLRVSAISFKCKEAK